MKFFSLFIFVALISFSGIQAQNIETALESSTSGIITQRIRLGIIAENVANVSTMKVEETGEPYRKKFAQIEAYKHGVRVKAIGQSNEPFFAYPDSSTPQSTKAKEYDSNNSGALLHSNVSLPEEMLNLTYTEVMYEANVTCFKTSKTLYQSTIDMMK